MKQPKWTAGPWFANERFVSTRDGGFGDIAVCQPDHDASNENARLIAAAPELFEALVHIEEYWNGNQTEAAMIDALEEIGECARAALAKAKG